MGIYHAAEYKPVGAPDRYSNGVMETYRGIVLHVNDAMSDDLYEWINGDHDMSCHFQVNTTGHVYQYIDTKYSSWCQSAGNDDWLSIETEGMAGTPLTNAQLRSVAGIVAWASKQHGFPLQLTSDPINGHGFGWHGMGGAAWGGHFNCPSDARRAQMSTILNLAKQLNATTMIPPNHLYVTTGAAGDTLPNLAHRFYGDTSMGIAKLLKANGPSLARYTNGDRLPPNWKIQVPS